MRILLCLGMIGLSGCAASHQRQLARNAALNDAFFNERIEGIKSLWNASLAR